MNKKDYYEVLGLSKGASADEIKSAYRKLAKQYHPDICKEANAESKFKEIQEANNVLSDESKRRQYDQFGHASFDQMNGGGYQGSHQGFGGFDADDLGDIFGNMFGSSFGFGGGSRSQTRKERGNDSVLRMRLSFEEAVFGTDKEITIDVTDSCEECHGKGGFDEKSCPDCHGSGTITQEQRTVLGSFLTKTTCTTCSGKGKTYERSCSTCRGKGTVRTKKTLSVKIPAGVDNGNQLRLSGKGDAGRNGGPNGDLYIEFAVENHSFYVREEDDIYLEVPLTLTDAILGVKKEIPTLYGNVKVSIPAGTETGEKQRLRGKGVDNVSNRHKGDMYIVMKVVVPKKLSREQKDLINKLSKTDLDDNSVDKFKDFVDKN